MNIWIYVVGKTYSEIISMGDKTILWHCLGFNLFSKVLFQKMLSLTVRNKGFN